MAGGKPSSSQGDVAAGASLGAAVADTLAGQHRGCRPDVLLGQVADYADGVLGLLGRHMASLQRRRLDVVAVCRRGCWHF